MERFEFLTTDWLAALEQGAQRLLATCGSSPPRNISYVEIFTGVPPDEQGREWSGFVLSFADHGIAVRRAEHEDEHADCIVRIDYTTALASMHLRAGQELDALAANAFAAGTMTMRGSPAELPIPMSKLHDMMVDVTALQDNHPAQ